jgi:anionic cell wall polymer biosynthesis LytR-Cps2A-Psr (LCP) family protein
VARGTLRRWAAGIAVVVALLVTGALVVTVLQGRYALPEDDLFGGGDGSPSPAPSPTPEPGADITGPLNLLLVGIDPRASEPTWVPNADAVLILHVPASLTRAYLFSLPRDLRVDVPPFEPSGYPGGRTKLTHAMSNGAQIPGEELPDTAAGFALLAETVSQYTGIERFDAGAVLNFGGFTDLVDAVGGVDIYVDQRVVSEHREPDGSHRVLQPGGGGYLGPQQVYEVGAQHLAGWEALDYSRQRYIEGSDYARQRHQQQLIKALVAELFAQDVVTNPVQLDRVLRSVGDALVFDGRGHRVIDFAFALRRVTAERITLVGLPGDSVFNTGGGYIGEELDPVAGDFLAAVREDRVGPFLAEHPELRHDQR